MGLGPNAYDYAFSNPVSYVDAEGLWGVGIGLAGDADAGAGYGAGGSAALGIGFFGGGRMGLNLGGFASTGGFVGGRGRGVGYPKPNPNGSVGVWGGVGVTVFFTNATDAEQLGGPFDTINANAGLGPMSAGAQYAWDPCGKTQMLTVNPPIVGVGIGVAGSSYPTNGSGVTLAATRGTAWQRVKNAFGRAWRRVRSWF